MAKTAMKIKQQRKPKFSTRETVKEFPYRPRLILNGVGDIAE